MKTAPLPPCKLCGSPACLLIAGRASCSNDKCDCWQGILSAENWLKLHGAEAASEELIEAAREMLEAQDRAQPIIGFEIISDNTRKKLVDALAGLSPQPLPRPDAPGWWVEEKRPNSPILFEMDSRFGELFTNSYSDVRTYSKTFTEGRWLPVRMPVFTQSKDNL